MRFPTPTLLGALCASLALSACEDESGAAISARIEKACTAEYGPNDQAVTECRMKQTMKAMDRIHTDHERNVDSAVH